MSYTKKKINLGRQSLGVLDIYEKKILSTLYINSYNKNEKQNILFKIFNEKIFIQYSIFSINKCFRKSMNTAIDSKMKNKYLKIGCRKQFCCTVVVYMGPGV